MINKKIVGFALAIVIMHSNLRAQDQDDNTLSFALAPAVNTKPKEFTLDSIKGVVIAEGGREVITYSDLMRPDISGTVKSFEDQIIEKLIYKDAQRFRLIPGDEGIEKYFNTIAKENNLTPEDFEKIAASAGLTVRELKDKLKTVQAINSMLDFKIRQNLVIPRREIEKYYNEHPETIEAQYEFAYALIPFGSQNKNQLKGMLKKFISTGKGMVVQFSDPFILKKTEIAPEKEFITKIVVGKITQPHETQTGFELFKLVSMKPERLRTLEERAKEIAEVLRTPKFNQLLEDYKKELMHNACILEFAIPA